jgi:sporulation protein YlmC with PRC-barrel domain
MEARGGMMAAAKTDMSKDEMSIWGFKSNSKMLVTPAQKLVGQNVAFKEGPDDAAQVKFLMVRPQRGDVLYAVVAPTGAGHVGEFVALPWDAINAEDWVGWRQTGLSLNISAEKFKNARRMDVDELAKLTTPLVQEEINAFYAPLGIANQDAPVGNENYLILGHELTATLQAPIAKLDNQLRGDTVETKNGTKVGTIDEIMVDVDKGRVPYVLVSSGGFLGADVRYIALPPQSLEWDGDNSTYRIDMAKGKLDDLPAAKRTVESTSVLTADLERLYDAFDVTPYWTN